METASKNLDSQMSPASLIAAIRKHWLLALIVGMASAAAVIAFTLRQPKVYEASGTLLFDPNPPRPLGQDVKTVVDLGGASHLANQEYYHTQHEVIKSVGTARIVVQKLGLARDPAFLAGQPAGTRLPPREVPEEVAAIDLASRVRVKQVGESRLARVTYEDRDPDRAKRILDKLLDTYVDQNLEVAAESQDKATNWLVGQLQHLKEDLESTEMSLHKYKLRNQILSVSLNDQSNMLREEIVVLNQALTGARAKREALASQYEEFKKLDLTDPSGLAALEFYANSTLSKLRDDYVSARETAESLMSEGRGENHPLVKAAVTKARVNEQAILREAENVRQALGSQLEAVNGEIIGLGKLVAAAKQQALDLNLLEIEYNRLRRTKDNTEKLYGLVLERTKESNLTQMMRFNNIRRMDTVMLPEDPVRPNVPLSIALGALGGLLLGFGSAAARELLDRSIKTPEDVEAEFGVNFLGLLPTVNSTKDSAPGYSTRRRGASSPDKSLVNVPELVVHNQPQSGFAEAARAIRTSILFAAPDKPPQVILVTSAGPAEGKTTVACCLSIAMAQAEGRVLLVDCDMRRPRAHRVFGLSNSVGVTTSLLDPDTLDQAIHIPENVPNLHVLSSGPLPPNPSELLHSAKFKQLILALRTRYERIVIDSPPILPVTDAAILAAEVDGTVVVFRAAKTSREVARRVRRLLNDVKANVLGAILNAVSLERQKYAYQYYYSSQGYPSDKPAPIDSRESSA